MYKITNLGEEWSPKPKISVITTERGPNKQESDLWFRAQKSADRIIPFSHLLKLQYRNIILTFQFSSANNILLTEPEMADLEPRMQKILQNVESLKIAMGGVINLSMGIRVSNTGNDLDILAPQTEQSLSGWIIPIVIGSVIVAGIIARWAYLESEIKKISDKYNGILRKTDAQLCENPDSDVCKKWNLTKTQNGYQQNETVIDSIKSSIKTGVGVIGRGVSTGLLLAIPLLMLIYLPRRRD